MATNTPPAAGGFLIAAGVMGGAVLGFAAGEPTGGLLIGLGLGVVLAVLIWWRGRG